MLYIKIYVKFIVFLLKQLYIPKIYKSNRVSFDFRLTVELTLGCYPHKRNHLNYLT